MGSGSEGEKKYQRVDDQCVFPPVHVQSREAALAAPALSESA